MAVCFPEELRGHGVEREIAHQQRAVRCPTHCDKQHVRSNLAVARRQKSTTLKHCVAGKRLRNRQMDHAEGDVRSQSDAHDLEKVDSELEPLGRALPEYQ